MTNATVALFFFCLCFCLCSSIAADTQPHTTTSFLSIGDSGLAGKRLDKVADAMSAHREEVRTVLLLGDNFYEDGISSTEDPLVETAWRSPLAKKMHPRATWHAIFGNHDTHKSIEAQIQLTHKQPVDGHGRWSMPDRYYSFEMKSNANTNTNTNNANSNNDVVGGGGGVELVQFVMIDTSCFDSNHTLDLLYRVGSPESRATAVTYKADMKSNKVAQYADTQLLWLEETLANASQTADWIVVAGHYPLFSQGDHGNNTVLVETLHALFEKYGVDLYLCGHDHSLQHIEHNGVHHIVNGSGSRKGKIRRPLPPPSYGEARMGFALHTLGGNGTMTTQLIGDDGAVLHQFTQQSQAAKRKLNHSGNCLEIEGNFSHSCGPNGE